MSDWTYKMTVNLVTGDVQHAWRKSTHTASGHKVLYSVDLRHGQYYWSANIMIANRPDLSRMAYGMYAATPHSLSVAKMRATKLGKAALKAAQTPRHLTRAA